MSTYKLTYFDVRGIGEPIRMLLHYGGQKFEDVRPQRVGGEWKALKPKTPFGKLPVLDIDNGKIVITQSSAIARYLAEKYGLAGKDDLEKARVDELLEFNKDVFWELIVHAINQAGFPPSEMVNQTFMVDYAGPASPGANFDKADIYEKVFLPGLERFLPIYQKVLKESKSGFAVDSGLTFVDFFIADFLHTLERIEPEVIAKHDGLHEYIQKVYDVPQIKEHIQRRPDKPL